MRRFARQGRHGRRGRALSLDDGGRDDGNEIQCGVAEHLLGHDGMGGFHEKVAAGLNQRALEQFRQQLRSTRSAGQTQLPQSRYESVSIAHGEADLCGFRPRIQEGQPGENLGGIRPCGSFVERSSVFNPAICASSVGNGPREPVGVQPQVLRRLHAERGHIKTGVRAAR